MHNNKITGLIGYPLSHSFSKDYFTNKFKEEGINNFSYQNFEIDNINMISEIIKDHKNLIGLNVTIPHKETVLPYLDQLSEQANEIGAVNTICIEWIDNKPYLFGYNTDSIGFSKSLDQLLEETPTGALILGTGGASKAVKFVLNQRKIRFLFVSRSGSGNKLTYNDLDNSILRDYPLIINTTPVGMFPKVDLKPEIPYDFLGADNYLIDLIYNPIQTLFLKRGEEAGARTLNGMPMLIAQAEASWKLWNQKKL